MNACVTAISCYCIGTEANNRNEIIMTMKINSFSFGATSAYLCTINSGDNVMMDTGAEDDLTYDFGRKVNLHFNLNLTCLQGDFSKPLGKGVGFNVVDINALHHNLKPYKEMMEKYGVPYTGGMFCTDRMKLKPYKKYCDEKYGKNNYQTWLGIRFDEPKRLVGDNKKKELSAYKQLLSDGLDSESISLLYVLARKDIAELDQWKISTLSKTLLKKRIDYLNKQNIMHLADISEFDKSDINEWWKNQSFKLQIEEHRGNCIFCPKKSNLKLAAAQRDCPEQYEEFVNAIKSSSVRVDKNTGRYTKMYRGNQSLESLIATFDGSTGEEIKARIRGGKQLDTNSCSESCEVF